MSKLESPFNEDSVGRITRGKLWWKEEWYSICSMHGGIHLKDCHMCNAGGWYNVWEHNFQVVLYRISHKLWIWYINRKR